MSTRSQKLSTIATRWAVTLCEPLIPTSYRIGLDEQMSQACRDEPGYASIFFGGVLADLVRTLPQDDPWRGLSGKLDAEQHVGTPPDHARVGAWHDDGTPFGAADVADLVPAVFSDPLIDVAVVATSLGLHPAAAALIAFAEKGWQRSQEAVEVVGDRDLGGSANSSRFGIPVEALSWVMHRRRSHH